MKTYTSRDRYTLFCLTKIHTYSSALTYAYGYISSFLVLCQKCVVYILWTWVWAYHLSIWKFIPIDYMIISKLKVMLSTKWAREYIQHFIYQMYNYIRSVLHTHTSTHGFSFCVFFYIWFFFSWMFSSTFTPRRNSQPFLHILLCMNILTKNLMQAGFFPLLHRCHLLQLLCVKCKFNKSLLV